jgi:hypothetical protein
MLMMTQWPKIEEKHAGVTFKITAQYCFFLGGGSVHKDMYVNHNMDNFTKF